jgi:hypothetical protein
VDKNRWNLPTFQPAQEREFICFDSFCSVEQIWKIEASDVIANDNIRINLLHKISPALKHFGLVVERENLRTHDMRACVEREDIANEGFLLSWKKEFRDFPLIYFDNRK